MLVISTREFRDKQGKYLNLACHSNNQVAINI